MKKKVFALLTLLVLAGLVLSACGAAAPATVRSGTIAQG